MPTQDELKLAVAEAAAALAEDGMVMGLGSGSTAMAAVTAVGRRVAQRLRISSGPQPGHSADHAGRKRPHRAYLMHAGLNLNLRGDFDSTAVILERVQ